MGTQTVGSNGATQKPNSDGLARQGSLYNLTLDEVQHQLGDLGKPLSSMNLDELLKSVWIAEANQGMSSGPADYSELSMDLTKKTVDQVWQDIQLGQKNKKKMKMKKRNSIDGNINNSTERRPTLGEMTLEDFLAKAGIVAESSPGKNSIDSQEAEWMHYQIPPIQQQNVFMQGHYPETHMAISASPMMGTLSDTRMSGRKRVTYGGVVERIVERRQKRMIKNRESAARSRERKQAYTHELENKISRLEEENERLKRQKEVEKVLPWVPPPEPKYQLRRTTSASF